MNVLNEGQTGFLKLVFRDEFGNLVVPTTISYRIDDYQAGVIRDFSELVGTEVVLTPEDTRIIDQTKSMETRIVSVIFQYGNARQGTGRFLYKVLNITGIITEEE